MIPVRYTINGDIVEEPLNMSGSRLELDMQTVAVPRVHVENIKRCVEKAGLRVKGLVLKPLASSLGALSQEEMSAGCISICIGGGTTGIVLYESGRVIDVISIPIGGDHITSDLSAVMQLSLYDAEGLKRRIFDPKFSDEALMREGFNVDLASDVIIARLEELFVEYVQAELSKYNMQLFPAGIILSGGVSFMAGVDKILADILRMPVRRVHEPVYTMPPNLDNAAFVSSAGILRYISMTEADPYLFMSADKPLPGSEESKQDRSENNNSDNNFEDNNEEYNPAQDEIYDDDEDEDEDEQPQRIGDFLRKLGDQVKKLF